MVPMKIPLHQNQRLHVPYFLIHLIITPSTLNPLNHEFVVTLIQQIPSSKKFRLISFLNQTQWNEVKWCKGK